MTEFPDDPSSEIEDAAPETESGSPAEPDAAEEPLRTVEPAEILEVATEFVTGLLEALGLEGEVTGGIEDDRAAINVAGANLGILIGRRGQTLDAVQELTRTAVQRRLRARVRLLVDVEGYRARRRSSLEEYAIAMATRAIERGTEIELEPMSAYERKICHDAVADIEGAISFSEGEEPQRKVVIRAE